VLLADARATVVGFFEQDAEIGNQVKNELGLERFDSVDSLLDDGLDLAVIEALDPDVAGLSEACVGRVPALLVEKPGAHHPDAAEKLAGLCRNLGTIVEFGYQLHYMRCMKTLRRVISSGCVGQVTLARFHGGCPVGCSLELWQSLPDDLGGIGYTEGCHIIEMALDIFGLPSATSAFMAKLPPGEVVASPFYQPVLFGSPESSIDVQVGTGMYEDVVTAMLTYTDKVITIDLTAWESGSWVEDWAIQIYGTNGTVQVDLGREEVRLVLREGRSGFDAGRISWMEQRSDFGYTYERQLDSLIRRIRGFEVEEKVDLDAGMGVLRVLRALYESASSGGSSRSV
jgi:predicted dehydrogenase